jgi:hypothetical protein
MAICPHLLQDRLVWAGTPTSAFLVKSAYHLEVRRRSSSVPSTSIAGTPSPIWLTIWSLHVPGMFNLLSGEPVKICCQQEITC